MEIHLRMCQLPNCKGKHPSHSIQTITPCIWIPSPILFCIGWSHYWTPHFPPFQFSHGHGRPWAYEGGNLLPLQQGHWHSWSCLTLFLPHFSLVWPTFQSNLWPRTTICLGLHSRICLPPSIQHIPFHCLSPTDQQGDGMSKSGIGNLSKAVHLKQTQRMVIPTSHGRIQSQFCHPFCHTTNSVFLDDGIWTSCLSAPGKDLPPQSWEITFWSICCYNCPSFPWTPMFLSSRLTHLCLLLIHHLTSSDPSLLTLDSSSNFFLTHHVSPWLTPADSWSHLALFKPQVITLYSLS